MDMNARPGGAAPGAVGTPDVAPQPTPVDSRPRSTADLVKGIAEDASNLVRQELLLAKQELTEGATVAAKAGALLAAAGVVGLFALGFLLTTLAWGLADAGLPRWVGFGIVALILLIAAAVLGVIGQRRMAKARLSPDRAQAEWRKATTELVEGARTGADNVRAEAAATAEAVKAGAVSLPDRAKGRAKVAASDTADGAREAAGGVGTAASNVAGGVSATAGRLVRRLRGRLEGADGGSSPAAGRPVGRTPAGAPAPREEPGTQGGPYGQDRG